MPSLFPDLFIFSFLAIFILRILIGFTLLRFAYQAFFHEQAQYKTFFYKFGHHKSKIFFWVAFFAELILGTLLVIGLYTQLTALVAGVLLFTAFILKLKKPSLLPHSTPSLYLIMSVVSLMLVFLGPGAFAFDYPL